MSQILEAHLFVCCFFFLSCGREERKGKEREQTLSSWDMGSTDSCSRADRMVPWSQIQSLWDRKRDALLSPKPLKPSCWHTFGKIQPFPRQSFSLDLSPFTDASCLEISLTCCSPDDIIALGITYIACPQPKMTLSDTSLLPSPKRSPAKTP